jgi:hypothetical protein
MQTMVIESRAEAAPMTTQQHRTMSQFHAYPTIPHGLKELTVPAVEAVLQVRILLAHLVIPLAAHIHAFSQTLISVLVPTAAVLATVSYHLLRFSAAALRVSLALSAALARYLSSVAAVQRLQKKLEREVYCFLLGPGNAVLKAAFWVGWWTVIGTCVRIPWWFSAT